MHTTYALGQLQTFLRVALELNNVITCFGLTIFQGLEQFFQFSAGSFCLGLGLGFAGSGSFLKFGTGFMQFFLSLAALFFQLGEQFLGISQSLRTGAFQMLEQAARKLLEQMQRGIDWLLVSRHGLPPG